MDFAQIDHLVLDVDGVLTPGDVTFDEVGVRAMRFCTLDGAAIGQWRALGCGVAILSGRRSEIVTRRARELGIEQVIQGADDKSAGFDALLDEIQRPARAVCYVADDTPDIPVLVRCGFAVATAGASPLVKRIADYVTVRQGGFGAVAEVVRLLMVKKRSGVPGGCLS